ncbi:MAG: DUF4595 domain-containing protein [Prevotella sp.]|nr:DUF4595 domain-containing protein [Prevotella sp.]
MVLGATMTFTSCSNDNDDNDATSTVINPAKVFTGGLPKSVAGMTIRTNEKGQVISMEEHGEGIVTFQYKEAAARSTDPDVVMTIGGRYVLNLYLDKNGFVRHCKEYYLGESEREDTWDFTYNSDGQLLTMLRSEGGNEKTTIKYQDGNIVETATVEADEPEESSSHKVYYTSTNTPSPIENKGCIMLFDRTFGIDMDEMEYAYYAGLLGKATKNLPIRLVNNKGYSADLSNGEFFWTLNSAGYPISLNGTYSFTW